MTNPLRPAPRAWSPDASSVAALCIVLVAVGLALFLGSLHQVGGWAVETDFYYIYLPQAREFMDGPPYLATVVHNPPGYAFLIGLLARVLGDEFVVAKVLTALATGGLLWLTFRLAAIGFGNSIALAATLLLGIALVPYSYLVGTDVVGGFAMTLPVWWLLGRAQVGITESVVVGLMTGIAYLIRSNTIVLVPVLGVTIGFWLMRHAAWRSRILAMGALVAAFVVAISPWLVLNASVNGSPMASTVHLQVASHFFGSNGGDAYGITAFPEAARRFHSLLGVLTYDPGRVVWRYLKGVLIDNPSWLMAQVAFFPGFLLVGAGIMRVGPKLVPATVVWLTVCVAGALLLGLVGFYPRYYVFLFPWLFILVVVGAVGAGPDGARVSLRWVGRLLLVGSFLVLLISSIRTTRTQLREEPRGLLALADSLRSTARPSDLMVGRKPHLAALAGVRWDFPYARDADDLVAKARRLGARYLVYSVFEARIWPGLDALRDPARAPAGFVPRFTEPSTGTIVYERVTEQ